MSYEIFPALPGLTWNVVKTPTWNTKVQQAASGKELRASYWQRPIWKFKLSYEFLRSTAAAKEYQTLVAFFNARQGAFDSFLFEDPSDHTVVNQQFGVGDGVTRNFTLVHEIGGWTEPVGFTNSEVVKVGSHESVWITEFVSNGVEVQFVTAPAVGAVLTWTGSFYYRVRFDKDAADFEQFNRDFWTAKKIELVGVI